MGRVWRAADEMLDRQVAVKEMRIDGLDAEDTRTRRERTLREARATARIDHPNVVRIYDVVDEGERLWIVMELVAGRSLEQIVVRDGPLDEREAARIGLELVAALRQVHAGGVLHRDIKPGNVLVERQGHRRVVLTDFGIAALQDAEALTMVGMLVGSPDYMAPERISGRPQGPPSDVWSLGATLCAALGGRSPFSRSTTLATLHAVLYEEPELPPVADDLRDVLAALLDKEPDARPGLEELEAALAHIVRPAYDVDHDGGFASRGEPVPGTTPVPEAGSGPDRTSAPGSGQRPGTGPASATARGPEFETVPEYDFEPGAVSGPDPTLVAGPDTLGPGPDAASGRGPDAASGSGASADPGPEPDAAPVVGSGSEPMPDAVSVSDWDADSDVNADADADTERGPDPAPESGPPAGQAQQPSAGPVLGPAAEPPGGQVPGPAAEPSGGRVPALAAEVPAGPAPAPSSEVAVEPSAESGPEPMSDPAVPPVPGPAEGESSSPPEPRRDAPEAVPPTPGPVPPTREEPAHDTHDIRGTRRIPRERPTPALLDAQLIRAARQHPSDLPEATSPPVHDAVPVRRTPPRKGSLDFTKPPSERPPGEAPAPAPVPDPTPVPEPSSHSEARNASTEVPSELRAEPGSQIPSVGVHEASARAVTEAALSTAPAPGGMPPGEFPGPAVPSGSGTADGARRGGRRVGLLAAGGVAAAGLVVWIVVAASGGPSGDRTGASGSSGPAVTAGGDGGASPRTSSSPTVEGTSRPPSLPPGAHREAGGYAWATPKGWRRDVKTGSEVHYTSPDGTQELAAKSSLAKGDLMDTWQTSERNAREGRDYRKIRLEETVFQGRPAVVWEYTFTLKGEHWHARLLGFDESGKSYQINTWYQPGIEAQALRTYGKVKDSFTVL
ncbi:serine/threonine-protein kinase [Streptomyces siamensis]